MCAECGQVFTGGNCHKMTEACYKNHALFRLSQVAKNYGYLGKGGGGTGGTSTSGAGAGGISTSGAGSAGTVISSAGGDSPDLMLISQLQPIDRRSKPIAGIKNRTFITSHFITKERNVKTKEL